MPSESSASIESKRTASAYFSPFTSAPLLTGFAESEKWAGALYLRVLHLRIYFALCSILLYSSIIQT